MHESNHHNAHGHDQGAHAPEDFGRAFAIGIILNLGFVVAEVVYGQLAHSLALLADAGHNLSDVLGLALAWIATILVRRSPTARRTYGLRRSSVLAAVVNALLLMLAIAAIAWEALQRLPSPEAVANGTVMVVAGVDPIAVIEIQRIIGFLKSRGIGVLITDHNVREMLDICDRAYIISEGRVLAEGTPAEIVENADVRRVYLGEHFRL